MVVSIPASTVKVNCKVGFVPIAFPVFTFSLRNKKEKIIKRIIRTGFKNLLFIFSSFHKKCLKRRI
jgi:fluoride ion exporter CrcB/FEX